MEKTVVLFEAPGMTQENYDAILRQLEAQGKLYDERRLSHVAFNRDGTWCVVDVWESDEAFRDFAQNTLLPIFAQLNINAPQPRAIRAHNYMGAQAAAAISA